MRCVKMCAKLVSKIIGGITGSNDAKFLKNNYQPVLDQYDRELINGVHNVEHGYKKLSVAYNETRALAKDIEAHEKERQNAYDALGNLLNKETDFEKVMWNETSGMYKELSKSQNSKSVNIKQKNVDSDPEMRFSSMMKYLEMYPQYQTKSSFKNLIDKIQEKEKELRHSKRDYHKALSQYNSIFSEFTIMFGVVDNKIKDYHKKLDEVTKKITEGRYAKSIFFKLASEEKKGDVTIDTLQHRLVQFEERFKSIKEQLSEYKGKKFIEIDY